MLKSYLQFINEGVSPETRDKIFAKAVQFAKEMGYGDVEPTINSYMSYVFINTEIGTWGLELEQAAKKGSISNYSFSQEYSRDENNLKWYIKFPGRSSRYDHRSNKKAGSFNTLKKLMIDFKNAEDAFIIVRDFLNAFGKEIDLNKTNWGGKSLKALGVDLSLSFDGNLYYNYFKSLDTRKFEARYKMEDGKFTRTFFDATTGELLYYALLASGLTEEAKAIESVKDQKLEDINIDNLTKSAKGLTKYNI
jgi:hypothetical protein